MRNIARGFAVFVVFVFLAGCPLGFAPPADYTPITLPNDVVADVARQELPTGSFQTFVAVNLDVQVHLYRSADALDTSVGDDLVVMSVSDPDGTLLLRTIVSSDGAAVGAFSVPTDLPFAVLTVEAPGYIPRSVPVADPATLSAVVRTMALAAELVSGPLLLVDSPDDGDGDGSPDINDDTDGDGVPDNYDMFPRRPLFALEVFHPNTGTFTVGFEDFYPDVGDADYNDFLAQYTIQERTLIGPLPVQIIGEFEAVARAAGYNHEFGIVVRFPNRVATLEIERFNSNGEPQGEPVVYADLPDAARVVVFPETIHAFDRPEGAPINMDNGASGPTRTSLGHRTVFTLTFDTSFDPPQVLGPRILEEMGYVIDRPPFDPYLLILGTGFDVHLIGEPALPEFPLQGLPASGNPPDSDGFVDADGYPRGLLVPRRWAQPQERVHIASAYEFFDDWMNDDDPYSIYRGWYHLPTLSNVVIFDDEL